MLRREIFAHVAQSAEHFLGKEEVSGSNPDVSLRGLIAASRLKEWVALAMKGVPATGRYACL
jgi:hypothetical protein